MNSGSRTLSSNSGTASPTPYRPGLTPATSPLRPHVLARERLRLWRPLQAQNTLDEDGQPINLSQVDIERIRDVLTCAWAESTRESYGSGLLVYHVFCDVKGIQEIDRAPASQDILTSFLCTIAGSYSGKTISNYIHGVRAWHIIHGVPWAPDTITLEALLKAAEKLTPPSSKRKQRQPYTLEFIAAIIVHLDPNIPLHAAVKSCLLTVFFGAARLGEFTVRRLDAFDPARHVKISDVRHERDRKGLSMTVFKVPDTKSGDGPEDVYWSAQEGSTDPEAAHANHVRVNNPQPSEHLFAYTHNGKRRPLTKTIFLTTLNTACRKAGLAPLQGHGIRIGATLEYLLRGIPFETVKVIGRWKSDAFLLYLRKHAQIMAPYMQADPSLHEDFVRYAMPPVR